MVRYAVGYQSRAFVTFGAPISLDGCDPESRREMMALAHMIRETIGRLHKVLPTAVLAAALKPSITRRELEARAEAIIETVRVGRRQHGRHVGTPGDRGRGRAARRAQHHPRRARRTISRPGAHGAALLRAHACSTCSRVEAGPANALMIGSRFQSFLPHARRQPHPQTTRLTLRHAKPDQLRATVHRRRDDRRSDRRRTRRSKLRA